MVLVYTRLSRPALRAILYVVFVVPALPVRAYGVCLCAYVCLLLLERWVCGYGGRRIIDRKRALTRARRAPPTYLPPWRSTHNARGGSPTHINIFCTTHLEGQRL